MASKLNLMTFLQQARGLAEVAARCPQPRPPARLLLLALSSAAVRRGKMMIAIEVQKPQDNPSSVSITHVTEGAPPTPVLS